MGSRTESMLMKVSRAVELVRQLSFSFYHDSSFVPEISLYSSS
jgi:hypothetical protein